MFVGALVAQIALGFVLAITFAALNNFTSAPSLRSALFQLILAFALFYMATIIPAKAAAMAGVDMARGIESLAKKGALMAGGRAKNLGISYLKNRELTKAREIALQDEIAKATAGKSGISRVMAKRGVINADKRERFADKYLQRGILLGQTKDDMDKLTEESYDQALDERRARLRRHNEEEYDYQDEREYKKKLDEQTQDAYRRQQQLGNRAAYDFADEKERQRGFKNVDAEIQDRLIRLQKPDVFEELEDEEREKQLLSYDQAWGKVDGRRGLGSDAGRDISEIRKARDTYLTYRGQSFIGSQAFNETVKEYLKYERMSDDEKLIVNNMLTQMDGAKTVDEYSQKHQNFTYKDATGQKAWMEFWKDVGAPNGFVSASRAGSATDQMMLSIVPQLMAEKNPEYYRDLAVDLNKAAKSAKRSGQFTMEFTDIPRAAGLSTPANLPEGANGPLVHKLVTEHNDLAGRAHLTPDQQNRLNRLRNALGRYGYRP